MDMKDLPSFRRLDERPSATNVGRGKMMPRYNDELDADQQITVEEQITSIIADKAMMSRLTEEECAQLGRDILLQVLVEFRPDLIHDENHESDGDSARGEDRGDR